jgi:hypothetical protein
VNGAGVYGGGWRRSCFRDGGRGGRVSWLSQTIELHHPAVTLLLHYLIPLWSPNTPPHTPRRRQATGYMVCNSVTLHSEHFYYNSNCPNECLLLAVVEPTDTCTDGIQLPPAAKTVHLLASTMVLVEELHDDDGLNSLLCVLVDIGLTRNHLQVLKKAIRGPGDPGGRGVRDES